MHHNRQAERRPLHPKNIYAAVDGFPHKPHGAKVEDGKLDHPVAPLPNPRGHEAHEHQKANEGHPKPHEIPKPHHEAQHPHHKPHGHQGHQGHHHHHDGHKHAHHHYDNHHRPHASPEERHKDPAEKGHVKDTVEKTQSQLLDRIQQLMGGAHVPRAKLTVHDGKLEFTFASNASTTAAQHLISQSSLAGKKGEMIVSFLRHVMVIRLLSRKGGNATPELVEVLLPLEKGKHTMVHVENGCFGAEEIELCAQLYKLGNTATATRDEHPHGPNKQRQKDCETKDAKDKKEKVDDKPLTMAEVKEQLQDLGVQMFMPPILSPALGGETTGDNKKKCLKSHSVEKLWSGIAGYGEVKAAVKQTITLPLLRPDLFVRMTQLARGAKEGGKNTAGVLFTGPPGVGKTTMAKVAAHAAGVPLIYVPVESIMSKWYGEAENRLRKVFDLTRKVRRSVLFLDELDAFAGSRDKQMHEATRRILSVLLRQLDGLENETPEGGDKGNTGEAEQKAAPECEFFMVMVGATNRPGDLDAALMSRFEQTIEFPLPSESERAAIFGTYAAVLTADELSQVARDAPGFAGRDIVEVCRQAERIWLYRLLNNEGGLQCLDISASALKPPPIGVYLEAIAQHRAGNSPAEGLAPPKH